MSAGANTGGRVGSVHARSPLCDAHTRASMQYNRCESPPPQQRINVMQPMYIPRKAPALFRYRRHSPEVSTPCVQAPGTSTGASRRLRVGRPSTSARRRASPPFRLPCPRTPGSWRVRNHIPSTLEGHHTRVSRRCCAVVAL